MSDITSVIYKSLGLPVPNTGKRLSSKYNGLTRMADGNTDSNLDGKVDSRDRNGYVEPEELFQLIFSDTAKYSLQIKQLQSAGLEYPFEITPEIRSYTRTLLDRYKPKTQFQKALLLYRAVIPSSSGGLTVSEGGLDVYPAKNLKIMQGSVSEVICRKK